MNPYPSLPKLLATLLKSAIDRGDAVEATAIIHDIREVCDEVSRALRYGRSDINFRYGRSDLNFGMPVENFGMRREPKLTNLDYALAANPGVGLSSIFTLWTSAYKFPWNGIAHITVEVFYDRAILSLSCEGFQLAQLSIRTDARGSEETLSYAQKGFDFLVGLADLNHSPRTANEQPKA
jgi:hypothetical protein